MAMTVIWVSMIVFSILFAAATGRTEAVTAAAMEGAVAAVELCLSIGGLICLWSGIIEIMNRAQLSKAIARLLSPILNLVFPNASKNPEVKQALSANVSANMLGLGNAATPMGIRAATGMARELKGNTASNELCRLVVMNTASIQILPTTVAGIRAAAGSSAAFDILPAVWITSVVSLAAGLMLCTLLERWSKE